MIRSVTNPDVLARVVTELGGTMVQADTFQFDLPLSAVKEVIPKISELGCGVRKISERVADHPHRLFCPQSVARLEIYLKSD
jgi:hypothetical protein